MNQPSILYVSNGPEIPLSRVKAYYALENLASRIDILFAFRAGYKRTLWDKLMYKLKLANDPTGLNKQIIQKAEQSKLDLAFIVKGVNIKPRTLKKLSILGIKTISWSNDDMWGWHNRSLWYTWGLKHYDLVVTQKSYNCNPNELPSLGVKKLLFQNKAFDPRIHYPITECSKVKYKHDVVFVGTYEPVRLEYLLYLAQNDIEIHVYGWAKKMEFVHKNLIFHDLHLYGNDYAGVFSCSKICLNFLRRMSRDKQTSRSIEIPACGGFMLAERSDEHLQLFKEGKEAEFFDSEEEVLIKTKHYLANENERKQVIKAGRKRCITGNFSFDNRMKEIINQIYI